MFHRLSLSYFLLVLVPLLVYGASVLTNDFVAIDDELLILDNPKVHGLTVGNLAAIFTSYDPELYIPLTLFSHQIEYTFFGANPVVYHGVNLILHIGSTLLLFMIFRRLFTERIAFLCALIFAIHPLNTEAVAWASARKDVLSAFFFLCSVHWYLQWRDDGRRFWMSVIAFAFGLLSKVSILFLPLILILLDWVRGEEVRWREKMPYIFLSILFFLIALFGKPVQMGSFVTPVLLSFASIPFYLWKFVAPLGLSVFYPFTEEVSLTNPQILSGLLFMLFSGGVVAWSLRRTRTVAFGITFFLLMLAPSLLNVLKGGENGVLDIYFASDRYIYLAMIGLLYLVGICAQQRRIVGNILMVIAILFGIGTYRQSHVWASSELLFQNVIDHQENSHVAYNNLAGIMAKNDDMEKAVELYQKSLNVKKNSRALFNLAQIAASVGNSDYAIKFYEQMLEIQPRHAQAQAQVGSFYLEKGDIERAYEHLLRARALDPNLPSVHYNLGLIFEYLGQQNEARAAFEEVLRLDPMDEQAKKKQISPSS
ncbi:hypothetical protein A2635_01890 [Candidatus Peribacteria bacterium RIFCSPHIGHO2_01_FULL_51_9]|nr:MAG: hypothetical protein A2635_01890 [Candidatus Peribacteria bacterium RIFCSPHIGHO2_01_FULL_51_9]